MRMTPYAKLKNRNLAVLRNKRCIFGTLSIAKVNQIHTGRSRALLYIRGGGGDIIKPQSGVHDVPWLINGMVLLKESNK